MSSTLRSGAASRSSMRPGTRASTIRHAYVPSSSAMASRIDRAAGATSPAESVASSGTTAAGTKRKERDFEDRPAVLEETNINVVVRCRGRNEREVRENSNVVVRTDGIKGQVVELALGSNALSNKSYNFDRVFSPAADQGMVFEEVVRPILDEMLAGFNCTIFAYGQTGTGKTYTMSGDMTETLGFLSDAAGIIPRVLQSLFKQLESADNEHFVKCSFIELYNEELRDLISVEETAKLKIYDDTSRRGGHATTVVQGMEEKHIRSAADGIKVLQEGSLKRQVAATKCNDLSSRSHTVFTINVHVRRTNDDGSDEMISAGKLNLVDLAGSENIQRSGAENKRAAEAGLINKSLLTLGRVINALVDRGSHIPYRESKLTRLLQDSLGGRTKTCIIATISPAKSNLEETISTLDYAFRAKNIRNKPQLNPLINKKMLLRDFAAEIERLKTELICHRQRSGVYLSNEAYEDMTAVSESRRIMLEEQSAKMVTLESNLRNKVNEFFSLTTTFMGLKKDHDIVRAQLDSTKEVLDQTELVLEATRKSLAEETHLRIAHEETESKLSDISDRLLRTLDTTVGDIDGLRAKIRRKSDLHALNRTRWQSTQADVADVTSAVEESVRRLRDEQGEHIGRVAGRVREFVDEERRRLTETRTLLDEQLSLFGEARSDMAEQDGRSKEDMDGLLEEIKEVRDTIKDNVGNSLQAISHAAEKIAADVLTELGTFHNQLHTSYSSLGKDFKSLFEDLLRCVDEQRSEADDLRRQLEASTAALARQNEALSARVQEAVEEERREATKERETLMMQMGALLTAQAEAQEKRLAERAKELQGGIAGVNETLGDDVARFGEGMDAWYSRGEESMEGVRKTRDLLKTKLKEDWTTANDHSISIQATAKSVHAQTVQVVDEQVADLGIHMRALDDFVTRARSENAQHHAARSAAMTSVSETVDKSFGAIAAHFDETFDRVRAVGDEVAQRSDEATAALGPVVEDDVCAPLRDLRNGVERSTLREYVPTGTTPEKKEYDYPRRLPHTKAHSVLVAELHGEAPPERSTTPSQSPSHTPTQPPPADPLIFADLDAETTPTHTASNHMSPPPRPPLSRSISSLSSLREVHPNVANASLTTATTAFDPMASTMSLPASLLSGPGIGENVTLPIAKTRSTRSAAQRARGKMLGLSGGVENAVGAGRRKSPRLR